IMDGKTDDFNGGDFLSQLSGGVYSIHDGHIHIHDDNIGIQCVRELDCLPSVFRFSNDEKIRIRFNNAANAFTNHLMVISNENSDTVTVNREQSGRTADIRYG